MAKVKKGTVVTAASTARATTTRPRTTGRAALGKAAGPAEPARKASRPSRPPMKAALVASPRGNGKPGGQKAGTRKAGTPNAGRGVVAKRAKDSKGKRRTPEQRPTVRSIRIRELDPVAKCGPGTSVQFLYRVDELLDGAPHWHLVFFDRHGWYCEHGRNCPAVADVRKHGKEHHLFTD